VEYRSGKGAHSSHNVQVIKRNVGLRTVRLVQDEDEDEDGQAETTATAAVGAAVEVDQNGNNMKQQLHQQPSPKSASFYSVIRVRCRGS
jgi:hypothetical protein